MSDKAYEDVSDEDVRALAEERRKHQEGARVALPAGVYRTKVKVQKQLADVPEAGIFAGQNQVLLTHAVISKDGEEVLGAVFFNRLALPLKAAGKTASMKGISIALSNVLKLLGTSDAEDGDAAVKDAIDKSKAALDGQDVFVGAECFLRVEYEPYKDKNTGEQKTSQRVRIAQFLRKGEELSDPAVSTSDILEVCCDD